MSLLFRTIVIALLTMICSSALAAKKINFGGTNHFIYAYGTADGFNTGGTWYIPALNIRPPVGTYHLDPGLVNAQIEAMKASEQNSYTITLWNSNIGACELSGACNDGVNDGVWGEVMDNSTYAMRPQHRANLKALVGKALDVGFRRIFIRFGQNSYPESWTMWDETKYQQVWNFMVDARNAAREEVNSRGLSYLYPSPRSILIFDLGAESGGLGGGQRPAFMTRLWQDYNSSFGNDDTIGYSIAWAPGRFNTLRSLLTSTGALPNSWGVDIYDNMTTGLNQLYNEMGPLRNQPVHILETYFNRIQNANEAQASLNQNEFQNFASFSQWPTSPGTAHFSQKVVSSLVTKSTFYNYMPMMAATKMHITSSNANIIGVTDINCASSTSFPCSVQLKWTAPPSGRKYGIYIRIPGGTSLVFCETSARSDTIPWISLNPDYKFDVYEINASTCNHPTPNPGSTLRATAEATPF
jgi:hypothetical protein